MPKKGQFKFGLEKFGSYITATSSFSSHIRLGDGSFSSRSYYLLNGEAAKFVLPGEALLSGFGTLVRGIDMASKAIKDALENVVSGYELKFYIQDTSSNWVDFSDRVDWRGKSTLRRIGQIQWTAERGVGALQQRTSTVICDNSDHFWDKPFPSSIKPTFNSDWVLIRDGSATASWKASTNAKETALYHHKAAIRAHVQLIGEDTYEAITLGVFLIEDIATATDSDEAHIKLAPLSSVLINNDADEVKNGLSWHINRQPKFLVEQLLKQQLADSNGNLPSSYDLEDILEINVPLSGTSAWVASHYGRPPERTTNQAGTSTTWNTGEVQLCRAMVLWEYGNNADTKGTVSVTPGSAVVTGSGTQWVAGTQPPRVGDSFILPKEFTSGDGGSVQGNEGKFTIASIASDTSLTLDRQINGSAAESGRKYSIPRLYLGVGSQLYEYNITTDTHRTLTTGVAQIGSNFFIRRLWHNQRDATYPIWGAALTEPGNGSVNGSMKIFRFRWNSSTPEVDVWGDTAITNVYLGDLLHRDEVSDNTDISAYGTNLGFSVGYVDYPGSSTDSDGSPITIPYRQVLVNREQTDFAVYPNSTFTTKATWVNPASSSTDEFEDVDSHIVQRGFYSAVESRNESGNNMTIRYSMGQVGVLIYQDNYSTKGGIVFVKADGTVVSDYYTFTYHLIDLAQSDPGAGAPTVVNLGDSAGSNHLGNHDNYFPVCGCADPDNDDVYIGLTKIQQTDRESLSAILKITAYSASPNTTVSRLLNETAGAGGDVLLMEMVASASRLFVSTVDIRNITGSVYSIYAHSDKSTDIATISNLSLKYLSTHMIQALQLLDLGAGGAPTLKLFYQIPERGIVAYINDNTTRQLDSDGTPPVRVATQPATSEDAFVLNGTVVSSAALMEAYWISSTAPTFNQINRAEGKFYLSKWSNTVPARIELADFSGMSLWDAITQIAEMVDARFGFKPDGNFFFKRRPQHTTSVYTFTNNGQDRIFSISKGRGLEHIVNHATRIPSRVGLGDIKLSVQLTGNSQYGQSSSTERHTLDAVQRDLESKIIKLICVQGGRTASAGGNNIEARFHYTIFRATATSVLNAAYAAGSEGVDVESVEGVVYGTVIDVRGVDANGDAQNASARAGYKVQYSISGTPTNLTINAAIDDKTSEISVDGSFDLTSAMVNGHTFQPGDIILVADLANEQNWEYMQLMYAEAQKLHVARGVGGNIRGAVAHSSGERVILLRRGTIIYTASDLSASLNFSKGDTVTLDHPDTNVWSGTFVHDPNDTSSTTASVEREWIPIRNEFVPIGGENGPHSTGLALKLGFDSAVARKNEPRFSEGDIIRVESPGLVLSQDQASIKQVVDMASQARWNKRESRLNDNRFYDERTALWVAQREVNEEANPKYTFHVQSILTPWLSQLDVVDVEEENLLSRSLQHKEAGYIAQLTFDLNTRGLQEVVIRGINPY